MRCRALSRSPEEGAQKPWLFTVRSLQLDRSGSTHRRRMPRGRAMSSASADWSEHSLHRDFGRCTGFGSRRRRSNLRHDINSRACAASLRRLDLVNAPAVREPEVIDQAHTRRDLDQPEMVEKFQRSPSRVDKKPGNTGVFSATIHWQRCRNSPVGDTRSRSHKARRAHRMTGSMCHHRSGSGRVDLSVRCGRRCGWRHNLQPLTASTTVAFSAGF
jgi:hypothetical protein